MSGAKKYHYFVDGAKYETDQATMTGAEIKASVPGYNPSYQLYLEGNGQDPDELIADNRGVSMDPAGHGARKFYTVPPASFGI